MSEVVQRQLDEERQRVLERLVDRRLRESDLLLYPVWLPPQALLRRTLVLDLREQPQRPPPPPLFVISHSTSVGTEKGGTEGGYLHGSPRTFRSRGNFEESGLGVG